MLLGFRRFLIFLAVLWVLHVFFWLLNSIPVTSENALFGSVSAPYSHDDSLFSSRLPNQLRGDFIVHEDKLYLKIQGLQLSIIGVPVVTRYDWTLAKLKKFRAEHPELDRYFPDPAKPNAGVQWILNKST
jgi:hypothetical protein